MARNRTDRLVVYLEAFLAAREEEARRLQAIIASDDVPGEDRFQALVALARLSVDMTAKRAQAGH